MLEEKECNTCGVVKSVRDDFYKRSDTGKPKSDCKTCYNQKQDERNALNPEYKAARRITAMKHYDKFLRADPIKEVVYPQTTITERAYIAGLVDGEGSIVMTVSPNGTCSFWIAIINTDLAVLEWVKGLYGGSIYERKKIEGRKVVYQYHQAKNISSLANDILPYMRIKLPQLELFLKMRKEFSIGDNGLGRKGIKLTQEQIDARREAVSLLKTLKHA